jgi:REP element-mobilizing transposase RayT
MRRAEARGDAGAYFVTVCTKDKECFLGDIVDGTMRVSRAGAIIQDVWDELPKHYADTCLDSFVAMPNHIHGIIVLPDTSVVGAGLALPGGKGAASSAPTLGNVIRTFKSISAIRVNRLLTRTGQPLWQRNYYEHIIRNEAGLDRIREYIINNPQNWMLDQENPASAAAAGEFEKELGYD